MLSIAVDGGLFHPNCRHRVTTYFYDLKEEQGKLEDDGIEIPLEEQEARKKRLLEQKEKRLKEGKLDNNNRQNRNQNKNKEQYERYKRVLGDEFFPDTFEEYQKIKYANEKKWNDLKAKYRTVNRYKVDYGEVKPSEILQSNKKIELPLKIYNEDVSFICKIEGVEEIEKEYGKLKNYDVVLTDERRQHILERRGQKDFEIIMENLKRTIKDFDEILDDSKNDKKGICYVKKLDEDKYCTIHISLSLKNEDYANSKITGIIRNQKNMKN